MTSLKSAEFNLNSIDNELSSSWVSKSLFIPVDMKHKSHSFMIIITLAGNDNRTYLIIMVGNFQLYAIPLGGFVTRQRSTASGSGSTFVQVIILLLLLQSLLSFILRVSWTRNGSRTWRETSARRSSKWLSDSPSSVMGELLFSFQFAKKRDLSNYLWANRDFNCK